MSELEPFFNSAEECATYEKFCAEQERGDGKFELAAPALVCRWRMARRAVPMLNRHIRALSQRVVNGAPLTTNMLSWAKQHVEWSLAAGDYRDSNGVLMLVIDVNGDALMSVGPYEPLADRSRGALAARAAQGRREQSQTAVAPELMGAVMGDGRVLVLAAPDERLCGAATLVEQLVTTQAREAVRALGDGADFEDALAAIDADPDAAAFLISDEHGVVVEDGGPSSAREFAESLSIGVAKLFR